MCSSCHERRLCNPLAFQRSALRQQRAARSLLSLPASGCRASRLRWVYCLAGRVSSSTSTLIKALLGTTRCPLLLLPALQVMWEDDSAARVAQVAEQLACSQSRLASYSAANSATVPASLHSTPRKHRPQAAASVPASHGIDAGAGRPEHVKRAAARVQSGSPRRSSSRARGHFAVKVNCYGTSVGLLLVKLRHLLLCFYSVWLPS